jgi:hypothetical protein
MISCRILAVTIGEVVTRHIDWNDGIIPPVEIEKSKSKSNK